MELIKEIHKLSFTTSGAHPQPNMTAGCLLTGSHIRLRMYSATARNEHEAKRNANSTAKYQLGRHFADSFL